MVWLRVWESNPLSPAYETGMIYPFHSPASVLGSRSWDRTNDQRINSPLHYRCAILELFCIVCDISFVVKLGGRGEIRTHEPRRTAGFQDRCIQPLCHSSRFWCPQKESNFLFSLTKTALCHLTMGAMLLYMAESKGFEPLCALQRPVISNHGQ